MLLAKLGNNTESLKAYDQAITLNPKDPGLDGKGLGCL